MLVAAADQTDPDHEACSSVLLNATGRLVTVEPVLAEAGWLLDREMGPEAEAGLYRMVIAGELAVEPLSIADWERIVELTETYADNRLGGVDSSVVAVAERLRIETVATIDHRHFRAVRPKHVKAFKIVP